MENPLSLVTHQIKGVKKKDKEMNKTTLSSLPLLSLRSKVCKVFIQYVKALLLITNSVKHKEKKNNPDLMPFTIKKLLFAAIFFPLSESGRNSDCFGFYQRA